MMSLYDTDFHAWTCQQAELLRTGRLSAADIVNIAEEIESMGRSEKRELRNRLAILLQHLLKWQYQPDRRGTSWELTIRNQRRDIQDHLSDNPSLKSQVPDLLAAAYERALDNASTETGLAESIFPDTCPWSLEQLKDLSFWPDRG